MPEAREVFDGSLDSDVDQNEGVIGIADRYVQIINILQKEYLKRHNDPWVIAYSGGKDSTLLLQLVWEAIADLKASQKRRKIYVTSNDTLVESPLVIGHLKDSLAFLKQAAEKFDLPIETKLTVPNVDQTFWVNVIGRGYIPPTRNFRWCTDRMKILPTNRLLEGLVARHKRAVLFIGTRRSESQNRRRNMAKRGVKAHLMNRHDSIVGCRIFAPMADLSDDDVWTILLQRLPPWGGTHQNLITLYKDAKGGECPLILTKDDAPSCGTTSPRFGCWTCTVVQKDRSLRGLIASGHTDGSKMEALADFREWLIELREKNSNRLPVRRDGSTKYRDNGSRVMGPFTLETRKRILAGLMALQTQIGNPLITQSELELIEDIWRLDRVLESGRIALRDLHKMEIEGG